MAVGAGFGDETWRLALAADVPALERAAELLGDGEDGSGRDPSAYDGHRARAFARAVEGRVDEALAELNEGWTAEWPFPSAYATDVARIRFLGGDHAQALEALRLAARSAATHDPAVPQLAVACVLRAKGSWRGALGVAVAGGSPGRRARNAAAVLRALLA